MLTINLERKAIKNFRVQEAIKSLRTNVQFCGSDIHTICITSCQANEGKSALSLELAISLAEADKKVLFVDADLRKSVIANRYHVTNKGMGLSQYLSGMNSIEEVLYATNFKKLHAILAGPGTPNPAELLGSKAFVNFINSLKNIYDYIIIDTPPVGSVIDAAVVSQNCDGAILVLSEGMDNYRFAQNVKQQIEKSGCRLLGAVLNKVQTSNKKGYYGYGYGYYSHYDSSYENEDNTDNKKN